MYDIAILSLSSSDWSYPYWTSRQFLMYELAKLAPVIYATGRKDLRQAMNISARLKGSEVTPFQAPPKMEILESRWPKTYRLPALDGFFRSQYVGRLQRRLDDARARRRVVYVWHPVHLPTVMELNFDILIYHPYDMFRHFVNAPDQLIKQEEQLCEIANALVTPHQRVAEALGHANTFIINNGVFLPAFSQSQGATPDQRLAELPGPRIGYFGAINAKVDFELMHQVCSICPNWQFLFVGPKGVGGWSDSSAYKDLRELPNVHFFDGVPFDKVSSILSAFDVGIVPYSLSGWARFSESPLKLYQYWAMGIPVVSSPLPNLEPEAGVLEVCDSPAEWIAGIERQLTHLGHEHRATLRSSAEKHSWAIKAEQLMGIMSESPQRPSNS